MKSESFVKLLRKVIREEVTLAVRKEMKSLLTEKKTDHSKIMKHGVELNNLVNKTQKKYVKDPMLNDILNETSPLQENRTMNYNSGMAQSFRSMMNNEPEVNHVAPMTDITGKPVNTNNENVATVVNAMTKDYSALMKAIDKKKGK
tara:strand:+ start:169 stop:606 length:438 start_codon:yes stop_codon:yes gene_type:complete